MDLFALPVGSEAPRQGDDDDAVMASPVPPEAFEHRGKWVALRAAWVIAVRDSFAALRDDRQVQDFDVSFFHVPSTPVIAR